jgi:hypothetical protein
MKKTIKKANTKKATKVVAKKVVKKADKKATPKATKPKPKKAAEKPLPKATTPIQESKQYNTPDIRIPTIVKIKVGRKYFIAKTHNVGWLLDTEIPNQLKKLNEGTYNADNIYYPLVNYIAANPKSKISYETLFTSPSGYFVIKYEYDLLQKSVGKASCLNTSKQPHIPKTRATKERLNDNTWFTESDRANYIKYLKKQSGI